MAWRRLRRPGAQKWEVRVAAVAIWGPGTRIGAVDGDRGGAYARGTWLDRTVREVCIFHRRREQEAGILGGVLQRCPGMDQDREE